VRSKSSLWWAERVDGGRVNEPDGFRDFVVARSAALVRSAWLLTGNDDSAHDLVQTALAKVWSRWSRVIRQEHGPGQRPAQTVRN